VILFFQGNSCYANAPYVYFISTLPVLETAFFWAVMQRVIIMPYGRFGTTCRSNLEKSVRFLGFGPWRWDR